MFYREVEEVEKGKEVFHYLLTSPSLPASPRNTQITRP
jgi:hypothetical protein